MFVIAGETSGDFLAARLLAALSERRGPLVLDGIGGPELTQLGLESRFPMEELALVGVAEVLPHLPRLIGRVGATCRAIRETRPDLVLSVDAPAFSLRVQARIGDVGAPRVHYVAPQAWAWRPGRAAQLAHIVDRVLFVLPFEEAFFERYGVQGVEVGHPLVERVPALPAYADRRRGDGPPLICLLPGSRRTELRRHLPLLEATVALLGERYGGLRAVLPTLPHLAPDVRDAVASWPVPVRVVGPEERFAAYAEADLALAASGTVGLELALARLPAVIFYRTSPLTAFLARRLIRVSHVSLINLIAGQGVVPELLQERASPDALAGAGAALLDDPGAWRQQVDALDGVARALGAGDIPPSERAAEAVDRLLAEREAPTS